MDTDADTDADTDEIGGTPVEAYEMVGGGLSRDVPGRRLSSSTVASYQLYTPDEEAQVRSKFDRKLVLFVALLFLLSFLDRSNIGNARIAGMQDDLQTDPPRADWYEWALTAFYLSYISFEWMSLLYKLLPAHLVVSATVFTWGVTASLQAVAPSYPVLIALRVLLGIGEAGFTGIPYYLSFFFRRDELAFRTAIFISAAPLATSFASTIAYLIVKCARYSPIAPWRLLFLVEGFPSVVASVVAWSAIPDSPDTASFLSRREKKVARLRLRHERPRHGGYSGFSVRDLLLVLVDPVAWLTSAMFFLTNMAYSSLPVFLPKIMTEMGHGVLMSQALSAPPYLAAFVAVLVTAHLSDRLQARTVPILLHALASACGYGILAAAERFQLPPLARYVAVYPAAVGFFNVVTLIIAWNINNQANQTRQGGGFAIMQFIGQCGPLVGTRLYPDADAPFYTSGMQSCAVAMFAVAVLAVILRLYLGHKNKVAEAMAADCDKSGSPVEHEGLVGSGKQTMEARPFRYML